MNLTEKQQNKVITEREICNAIDGEKFIIGNATFTADYSKLAGVIFYNCDDKFFEENDISIVGTPYWENEDCINFIATDGNDNDLFNLHVKIENVHMCPSLQKIISSIHAALYAAYYCTVDKLLLK